MSICRVRRCTDTFVLTFALSGVWAVPIAAQQGIAVPPSPEAILAGSVERPVSMLRASIALPGPEAPANLAGPQLEQRGVRYQPAGLGRGWCLQPFEWEATALCHQPLYFEEPNLERLGYYYGCTCDGHLRDWMFSDRLTNYLCTWDDESRIKQGYFKMKCKVEEWEPHNQLLQPAVSAAHFFGRVPALPYMVGCCHPHETVYELGADRPGSPVPYRTYLIPLSFKGIFLEGAAATGLAFLIP